MSKSDNVLAWGDPKKGFLVWEQLGQLTWEFNIAGSLAQLLAQPDSDISVIMETIQARIDEVHQKHADTLRSRGVRIFEIQEHNDRASVETDYGAPSQGLTSFRDLIDPTRSFRYEPVHVIDGIYQTHHTQAVDIGKALKEEKYCYFDDMNENEFPAQIHFSNGGATRAFSDLIETIVEKFDQQEEFREPLGMHQKGVILVPVPNYGLFLWRLREAIHNKDIEIVPVRRHDTGAVNQYSLRTALEDCRLENKRVLAYFDCNPQNPTGHIREKEETEEIFALFEKHNREVFDRSVEYITQKIDSPDSKRYIDLWSKMMFSVHHAPILIDDMSYEGLEFDSKRKPFSFAQISSAAAQHTAVLKGVSKIGLPGARIGMMLAHAGLVVPLAHKQLMTEFSGHSFGVDILAARYGTQPVRKSFIEHQENLRNIHRHRAGIIEAFFRGIDKTNRLSESQKETLIRNYADHADLSQEEAGSRLREGLTQFNLAETMDCGFFYRVNCESLRGFPIFVNFKGNKWVSSAQIHTGETLYWVFRSFGMHVVPASRQGCNEETLMVRITTSLPEKELFRFYDRMQEMQSYFFGKKPSVQLDLFRKNEFQPV